MSTEDSRDALLARLGRTEDWSIAGRDFRRLFSEFYPLVLRYFVRRGFGDEDSQDLAQETMLRRLLDRAAAKLGRTRQEIRGGGLAPGIFGDPLSPVHLNIFPGFGV